MLVDNSFSSSVETSLLSVSEYQRPFAAYDWVTLAGKYQMIHKSPEQSQASVFEAVPVPDSMNLEESKHQELQVSCPEKSLMHEVSQKALTSLVYSRRKRTLKPGGTAEHNLGEKTKHDDSLHGSIVPLQSPRESTKRKSRFNNCLVYSRQKRTRKSICNLTGETTIKGDRLDDASVSEHDCGETKRRDNPLENFLVYIRKKSMVRPISCNFTHFDSGKTKISGDQAESSAYSQRGQIVKADGAFARPNAGEDKDSGHQPFYGQCKQLVKSNGSLIESHIGDTKTNGDRSDTLLVYSRRKKREKSIGLRINGFLVYSRRKPKGKSRSSFTGHDPRETKKNGDQLTCSLELVDDTQVNEDTCSSDGTNDSCSSSKSNSERASSSSKSGEAEVSETETDTDDSTSPFRPCKHCDKPGTPEKMLICDECEEAYHASCCGVRMKEVEEIDDWLCPSCMRKKSPKAKIKGRVSRKRRWRITKPFVIGIRIGKQFQADVPDWSGPTMSDTSFVGEPLEIDESELMHDLKKAKNRKKPRPAVNWLQCREEDRNGDICGKWRRAPRSEVQAENWECFCCVFWNPSSADCAVPQEMETSEILKQLKYIKMLRPRPDSKKRKGQSKSHNQGKP